MAPWARRFGPFAWIVVSPIVTVPVTLAATAPLTTSSSCTKAVDFFIGGVASCPDGLVLPTLLPGLINLVPLAWLFVDDRQARRNAIIAGILGVLRLAIPTIGVLMSGPGSGCPYDVIACRNPAGYTVIRWGLVGAYPNSDSVAVVVLTSALWLVSLTFWVALGVKSRRRGREEGAVAAFWNG